MKPFPTENTVEGLPKPIASLPPSPVPGSYSVANRRVGGCPVQRVYPWLLFVSTAIAATFCLAYITKPVILANPSPVAAPQEQKDVAANLLVATKITEKLLPNSNRLPGDPASPLTASAGGSPPATSLESEFEETNIRVQHILDAESPSGDISRIIVDVPVLYRSRNLRWTRAKATEAGALLERLSEHQEKTRNLRDEGTALLGDWNRLMGGSIPADALRADSPSLPANQYHPLAPTGEDAGETIKLSNPDK
jgi:hypothetical protein